MWPFTLPGRGLAASVAPCGRTAVVPFVSVRLRLLAVHRMHGPSTPGGQCLVAPTASAARRVSIRMSALLANDARAGFDLSSAIRCPSRPR